jgi:hypothetical protein
MKGLYALRSREIDDNMAEKEIILFQTLFRKMRK